MRPTKQAGVPACLPEIKGPMCYYYKYRKTVNMRDSMVIRPSLIESRVSAIHIESLACAVKSFASAVQPPLYMAASNSSCRLQSVTFPLDLG